MDSTEKLLYQIGKLKNENLRLKKLIIDKNVAILNERKIAMLNRYALIKGIEAKHYDSLHKIVDVISDIHGYNKTWFDSEKENLHKDYKKTLEVKKKLLSLQGKNK